MAFAVFLLLLAIPLIEISLFILVGGAIGLLPTILLVLASAFFGSFLIRTQGLRTWLKTRATLDKGEMPVAHLFNGLCIFAAGVLFLVPGFFTDGIGLLLLIPPVRQVLAGYALRHVVVARGAGEPPPVIIETDYHEVDTGKDERH